MVALEGIGKCRDLVLTTDCVCANVHTHTCNSGPTKCGPPLHVHYLFVFLLLLSAPLLECVECAMH